MARAFILVLDSFGIGASLDAEVYGDEGADTFGHIVEYFEAQNKPFHLPNLTALGLHFSHLASTGKKYEKLFTYDMDALKGSFGYCVEQSVGKDTPSGHWEMAGLPVDISWGVFPKKEHSFPEELINAFIEEGELPGILGNCPASGTEIIEQLGQAHIETGKPIVYTSGDSVFQIAAHETHFGLQRLYDLCAIARKLVDKYQVGRVIARPFIGEAGGFTRTANRRDLSTPPFAPTLLDRLVEAGREVLSIGKISDIFAGKGVTQCLKGEDNMALFDKLMDATATAADGGLVFANFVDFDSKYGHRRNIEGYGEALMDFDKRLPEFTEALQSDDLVIITADHGCDPTFPGSDHTREHIPLLAFGPNCPIQFLGRRETFADIGQSVAKHLDIAPLEHGVPFN